MQVTAFHSIYEFEYKKLVSQNEEDFDSNNRTVL